MTYGQRARTRIASLRLRAGRFAARRAHDVLSHPRTVRHLDRVTERTWIGLDYPPSRQTEPRHTIDRPNEVLYGLIRDFDTEIARCLVNIAAFAGDLGNIPRHYEGGREPFWENGWFGGIDAAALYAFLRMERPSAFVEIGGGNSTMFARRAIRDQGSSTRLISIDPAPRADIDQLCDEHIRFPLEALDARGFPQLRGGDMVFLDGSHRLFTGSDAAVFFTDLLPRFPAGVLVGIDDIYLPYDYPPELHDRYYSEQYALAMYLLGGAPVDVVLPCTHVCVEPHLRRLALDVLAGPELSRVDPVGSSFWIRTR